MSLPLVDRWNPPYCGDSRMRIARDGQWFHEGSPVSRPALVKLFAGILRLDPDGYMLVTPVEKLSITVEDVPFLAIAVDRVNDDLVFTTNVGDTVTLDRAHALRVADDNAPYVHIRRGLEARIARPVYYQLAEMAIEKHGRLGVRSGGDFFPLMP